MLLKKAIEKLENIPPDIVYHATFWTLIPSIKAQGLLPAGEMINDVPIPTNYSLSTAIEEYKGVYLTNDSYFAYSMAEESELAPEEWLEDIVVLAIDTSLLD